MSSVEWINQATAWAGSNRWLVWVFLIIVLTGVADLVQRRLLHRLERKVRRTSNQFDDVLIEALIRPLGFGIWVVGLTLALQQAQRATDSEWFASVDVVRQIGVILAIAWFLLRLIRGGEARLIERVRTVSLSPEEGMDRSTVEALGKLLRAAVLVTGALLLLQTLGYSISGVLAFGGVAGIAVGFAARDLLANFFGGLMVHMDRPLAVGEWVRSPDREIEGTVEYIGWRISRIRTFDMRPLYVPNSVFANIVVENPTRMSHRRIYEIVGVRYEDVGVMQPIVDDIRAYLQAHEQVDSEQALIVNFLDFGASSLDIMVYCLVKEKRWVPFHAIKEEVLLEVAAIIDRHGAQVAFPTSTLHVASLPTPGGEPVEAGARPAAATRGGDGQ
ncbi:MAG: mechanosensitive ion channel family protein [Halofilum sp. (in: g-proteobacteria)]|nr:mechanosensitive ion channel family protein [Halofilum sp. (in: g-proteobacteria)]